MSDVNERTRPKTIFCDIDGTIVKHVDDNVAQRSGMTDELGGAIEKLHEWADAGHIIVLTTARKEGLRSITVKQLNRLGAVYDQLVMGISAGPRVLINNRKKDSTEDRAFAVNLDRNEGIGGVTL